ncbi:MAG: IS91 family transposase [Ferruginibacter sp.]
MSQPVDLPEVRRQLQQVVFKKGYKEAKNPYSKNVFEKLTHCHTAAIGMHKHRCSDADCAHEHFQYHNCGNRHCPNCGGMRRQQWIEDKTSELLPTSYYHIVFTLPHELNSIIMGNRKLLFKLLFDAASYTLLKLAKDTQWLGAVPGIISILHTWGQQLSFHPHVHCIVSGGGINGENWVKEKSKNSNYLFPKPAMQKIYKAYFLRQLRQLTREGSLQINDLPGLENSIMQAGYKKWNVYAKKPFGGPLQVLEYLGRYTHKVAITAHRIKAIDEKNNTITFTYKDYHARGSKDEQQQLTLSIDEFNRRYEQHILPHRFVKIRHYGYLKNYQRTSRLKKMFALMKLPPPPPKVQVPAKVRMLESHGIDITLCPKCKLATMELIATFYRGSLVKTYDPPRIQNKASP